jgi:hypothetical protein
MGNPEQTDRALQNLGIMLDGRNGMSAFERSHIEALVARGEELQNVEITRAPPNGPTPYTDELRRGHFTLRAFFVGEYTRAAVKI